MIDLHPVKTETFALDSQVNVDPKGISRPVDTFRVQRGALYMARPADHPRFHYVESWLIPELHIRVTRYQFRESITPPYALYVDIASVDSSHPRRWVTHDLYVDVTTHADGQIRVHDLHELSAAMAARFITQSEAELALDATQRVLDGIARHGTLERWLTAQGYPLPWPHDT